MLSFLPAPLRGVIAATLLILNIFLWCGLLFVAALFKLLLPRSIRPRLDPLLNGIASRWIAGNSAWMRLTQRTRWDVQGVEGLDPAGWYLVNCNHQTWVDIFVLQHVLNRRIPLLKFFLKQELIWVPIMGLAWWALEFPFMKRHSDKVLKRFPEKRLEDLETARRACEKFAHVPTSVMNFVEGTRFTRAKHEQQRSPYRHLLKPRAGALALAITVMGEQFQALLDVTIVYPDGPPTFWQFLRGDVDRVIVRMVRREIPAGFAQGDYAGNPAFRKQVQRWLHELWAQKDAEIDALLAPAAATPAPATV